MSTFENDQYHWRETYFVLFDSAKRPKLAAMEKKLAALNDRFTLANAMADAKGRFESLTVLSPDDFAALDICYVAGDEVREQIDELLKELKTPDAGADERARLEQLRRFDGRFDVFHFEQLSDKDSEEEDELLDPSALLVVLDALVEMTGGIAVDPQAGAML